MKPGTRTAMHDLITEIRAAIPFAAPQARVCTGACDGCSRKLLDFLEGELEDWEHRLAAGECPTLNAVSQLARTGSKIHAVLQRNGLIGKTPAK